MSLEQKIFSILSNIEGEIGLYFEDLTDGEDFTINPDKVFPAASTIKVPLVALILKKVEDGEFGFNDSIIISENNKVTGTGLIKDLDKSYKPTVLDLATLAIIISDNIATNQLIDMVGGVSNVTEFCEKLGLLNTKLQRKMLDIEAMKSGKDNITTAKDMGVLLKYLVKNQVVSKNVSQRLIGIMKRQQYRQKLPALIPAVSSYDPNVNSEEILPGTVVVANKTGDLWKVQNDVGIFFMPNNIVYVLSIFTKGLSDDSIGIRTISEISKIIYDEVSKKHLLNI